MKVLIVGASIGGPALAYWLHRYGIGDITVIERAPALREGGYCVDVRGVALDVVERMGLREVLRPLEANTLSTAVVDRKGRTFGRTPRGFGVIDPDDIEILRGDLARVMVEATRTGVRYRFDESIASLEQHAASVDVSFTSGARETFDVVIGADGVHSRARELAFGAEKSFVHPLGSCMAIWSAPNRLGLDREQRLFQDINRIGSVKSTNDNQRLNIAVFFKHAPEAFDHRDVPGQRRLVADAFGDAGWEFPFLIDEMWRAADFYSDITCQVRMPCHSRGRVALVGDAAYCPSPLSGQGTSLALVGAYVLATALAREPSVAEAFRSYEETIAGFVLKNQEIAEKIGSGFAAKTTLDLRLRRLAMSLMPHMPASQLIVKLALRGVREAARSLQLPSAYDSTHASTVQAPL
jgi:2-polyprenyl-6-methoxyphenol hydroxylase-like FAD-dependent oxidoreductase